MSEPTPRYWTQTHVQLKALIINLVDGEVRRCRLKTTGYGLVYAGNVAGGLLTVSVPVSEGELTDRALKVLTDAFCTVSAQLEQPVLCIRLLERTKDVTGMFYLARLSIYLGEQGRLI